MNNKKIILEIDYTELIKAGPKKIAPSRYHLSFIDVMIEAVESEFAAVALYGAESQYVKARQEIKDVMKIVLLEKGIKINFE